MNMAMPPMIKFIHKATLSNVFVFDFVTCMVEPLVIGLAAVPVKSLILELILLELGIVRSLAISAAKYPSKKVVTKNATEKNHNPLNKLG